jgi:hypothetical protein
METIIEPNDSFDFSKLSLTHPIAIQGGAYFTKIQYQEKPLYIQTTQSLTRQGLVKTGKKYYCDLMFDQGSIPLIHWFENLEERCQQLIYEKADTWFQNALEKTDVESAFNSIIRIFKSGKFYLVRTNIKTSLVTNEPVINIYNENEIPLSFQEITNETNLISILEVQGIKFTSRNFQIDFELKQIMVLDSEPIFKNCLIKTNTKKEIKENTEIQKTQEIKEEKLVMEESPPIFQDPEKALEKWEDPILQKEESTTDLLNLKKDDTIRTEEDSTPQKETCEPLELTIEELESEPIEDIKEINVEDSLENPLETITLKKPNQVYFELYKEARTKAKEAKKNLILAYLEAKNIKKTYLLDDVDNASDDSDLDAEIDEISESELEGL